VSTDVNVVQYYWTTIVKKEIPFYQENPLALVEQFRKRPFWYLVYGRGFISKLVAGKALKYSQRSLVMAF